MNNSNRISLIREKLIQALKPTSLIIEDQSEKHYGHPGAKSGKGHFEVAIASPAFHDKTRLQCHQMIYLALGEVFSEEIHALQIRILS